jgi:TfoX/Sxy family transcriptional regulator of competence genes
MKMTGTHDGTTLAGRVRKLLAGKRSVTERKMFGGTCFLLRGHMLCAAGKARFMFRVGKAQHAKALARGASPVVMNGTQFEGFVWVDPETCDARALKRWIVLAGDYVGALPPKRRSR